MTSPKEFAESGGINPQWLPTLDGEALAGWVRDLLYGRDLEIPLQVSDSPELILLDAYRDASPDVQERLAEVLVGFVAAMAGEDDASWREPADGFHPGDRLLLVAGATGDQRLVEPVRAMIDSGDFVGVAGAAQGGVQGRLLQTLARLGEYRDEGFWREQLKHDPTGLFGIAIRALGELAKARDDVNPFAILDGLDIEWNAATSATLHRVMSILELTEPSKGWMRSRARVNVDAMPQWIADDFALAERPDALHTEGAWAEERAYDEAPMAAAG